MNKKCFPSWHRRLGVKHIYLSMSTANSGSRPFPNSYWVIRDRFAAGEYPSAKDPIEAASKLRILLTAGIDHFVDLTEPGELVPYVAIAEEESLRRGSVVGYERHPITDMCVPRSPEQMAITLDAIDVAMRDGKTVYLHCWGGIGRTGTVVGCWLVRHGLTGESAIRQIAEWWQRVEKVHRHPMSPETREQREYVRDWTEPSPGERTA